MTLQTYLEQIKERCEAATEGPWEWVGTDIWGANNEEVFKVECETSFGLSGATEKTTARKEDRLFIQSSRTDVPMLLEMVELYEKWISLWPDERERFDMLLEKITEKYGAN